MNRRLKELADQARLYAEEQYPGSFVKYDPKWFEFYNEKFAELIVRECMKVAASQRNPANLNYKPSERFVEDLQQHFGVER